MTEPTAGLSYDAATNVVHVYPLPDEPEHQMNGFCWCQPLAEEQLTGGWVYIHRRSLDSPHIEEDAK